MDFALIRLRFWLEAVDPLYFPPGKAGNVLRGAFGTIFRRIACVPECRGVATCELRESCPYAQVFEPRAARGEGPSGLRDWPRPFLFRASGLRGAVTPGVRFCFDAHLFDVRRLLAPYFVLTFAQLAREGLGPGRGRAVLRRVEALDQQEQAGALVFDGGMLCQPGTLPSIRVVLDDPARAAVSRLRVRFVTPTELKSGQELVARPDFGPLFRRIRDRLSTLRALYGPGPLEVDFRAMGERAAKVELVRWEGRMIETERRSGRTGQRHPIGGFLGEAEYAGELTEFVPYLEAARWAGVGRHTVWGNGEVEVGQVSGSSSAPHGPPDLSTRTPLLPVTH